MLNKSHTASESQAASVRWVLLLLVMTLFVGALVLGSVKADVERHLWSNLPWASLGHFVLFGAMAALPAYGHGRNALARALLLALLLAVTTELLQSFVPGRHPRLRDVAIDFAGALAGCAFAFRPRSLRSSCRL